MHALTGCMHTLIAVLNAPSYITSIDNDCMAIDFEEKLGMQNILLNAQQIS